MRALQRVIADACLRANAEEELARNLRGFLVSHGVEPKDVEAILAAPRRLAVYRTLVRNGLSAVVLRMLPRTRARMNMECAGRFDADLARFVGEKGARTHYLRDVPGEFFSWVEADWRADANIPPYLADLASYELTQFAVGASASARVPNIAAEVALDRPLGFVESARVVSYGWAIHELSSDESGTEIPARREVRLLAYRDAAHVVRWLDLTPLAAAIIKRLQSGEALGAAVETACIDYDTMPADVLPEVARLLADLASRGVLVGAV